MQGGCQPQLAGDADTLASALPVVLFLLHPVSLDTEEQAGRKAACNPQLGPKKLLKCLKTLRGVPVLPLVGEVPLCLFGLLQACPTLCALGDFSSLPRTPCQWDCLLSGPQHQLSIHPQIARDVSYFLDSDETNLHKLILSDPISWQTLCRDVFASLLKNRAREGLPPRFCWLQTVGMRQHGKLDCFSYNFAVR